MTERATLHILSDDDAVRDSLDALFQANGVPARTYDGPAAVLQDLPTNGCLLIDLHARGSNPIQTSSQFRACGLSLPTIILVHQAPAEDRANNAIILQSPVAADELVATVKKENVRQDIGACWCSPTVVRTFAKQRSRLLCGEDGQ